MNICDRVDSGFGHGLEEGFHIVESSSWNIASKAPNKICNGHILRRIIT